jgi:hypothetical protein
MKIQHMSCSPATATIANQIAELAKRSPYGVTRMAEDAIIGALWDVKPPSGPGKRPPRTYAWQ